MGYSNKIAFLRALDSRVVEVDVVERQDFRHQPPSATYRITVTVYDSDTMRVTRLCAPEEVEAVYCNIDDCMRDMEDQLRALPIAPTTGTYVALGAGQHE